MRIAFVVDGFPHARAGTERQLSILIKALSPRAQVHVIVLRRSDWLFQNARELGVTAHFVPFSGLRSPSSWAGLVKLWSCIRRLAPDVVHTFLPVSNIIGVLAASGRRAADSRAAAISAMDDARVSVSHAVRQPLRRSHRDERAQGAAVTFDERAFRRASRLSTTA
jgi:hypothetical protein